MFRIFCATAAQLAGWCLFRWFWPVNVKGVSASKGFFHVASIFLVPKGAFRIDAFRVFYNLCGATGF